MSTDFNIVYSSSNPSVATVSQNGTVTGVSAGRAIIKVYMPETLNDEYYTPVYREYNVLVKEVSAEELKDIDIATPLTLVALEDGSITITFNGGITLSNDIHYTINSGDELTISKNTSGAFDIVVKKGDVVVLYSLNNSLGGSSVAAARAVTRAVDSLLKGKDAFADADAIEAKNTFYGLFAGAEKLVNNTERRLVLPATTLKEGCYEDMFNGCKGIEKAPELPAPALVKDCYKEMFYDCSKLNHVACLATDITATDCTKDWLGNAGTEATGAKVLETVVDMSYNSNDGLPEAWIAKKIVLVEEVKFYSTELLLVIGEADVTLTATVLPEDATDPTVTWTSSNPSIATVTALGNKGTVHGVSNGEVTITALAGDKTATCKVTVITKEENLFIEDTDEVESED